MLGRWHSQVQSLRLTLAKIATACRTSNLDARHDYCAVKEDIESYFPKLRPGGILGGHDYIDAQYAIDRLGEVEDWSKCEDGSVHEEAVKGAVDEFRKEQGGLPVYVSNEDFPLSIVVHSKAVLITGWKETFLRQEEHRICIPKRGVAAIHGRSVFCLAVAPSLTSGLSSHLGREEATV